MPRSVKRAQQLGLTLDEVEELLHLDAGGPDSCEAAHCQDTCIDSTDPTTPPVTRSR